MEKTEYNTVIGTTQFCSVYKMSDESNVRTH